MIRLEILFDSSYESLHEVSSNTHKSIEYKVNIFENGQLIDNDRLNEINDSIVEIEIKHPGRFDQLVDNKCKYFRLVNWISYPKITQPFRIRGVKGGIFFPSMDRKIQYNNQTIFIKNSEMICHIVRDKLKVLTKNYVDLDTMEKAIILTDLNGNDIRVERFKMIIEARLEAESSRCSMSDCIIL